MAGDETEKLPAPFDETLRALATGRRVFGRYTLEVIAGRGGMGVVWRARDEELERTVALKFLPEAVAADSEAIRDLKRETKRCLDLTHSHIVRVYDFVQDGAAAAIAMEFIDGESLAKRKANAPGGCLSAAELAPLAAQLCAALDYAHQKARIVHRDLKPANLLVTRTGDLRVSDFGISRSLSETHTRLTGAAASGVNGTLPYMSPQQLAGDNPAEADDIYALGATLYELLAGKPPFYRGDPYVLMNQIRDRTPAPLAQHRAEAGGEGAAIPPAWEKTILACLAKTESARPRNAAEVMRRLEGGAVADADLTEKIPPMPAKKAPIDPDATVVISTSKKSNRRTLWLGLAAAAVVGVLAVVFWPRGGGAGSGSVTRPAGSGTASVPPVANIKPGTAASADPKSKPAPPPVVAPVVLPREFTVTVDPVDAGAHLWLGPQSDVTVPGDGRALVKDLPDGELELVVQAPGYQPLTTRVTVKDGRGSAEAKLVAVKGAVEIAARAGTLVTAVDARGRETRVGTVPASGVLASENLLTVGAYSFKLEHADCTPVAQENVELLLGRRVKVAPTQVPLPGELRIFSVPTGAEVSVNGHSAGVTPATLRGQPSEVALAVEIFAHGYRRSAQTVTLKPKETRTLNVGTLAAESGGVNFEFARLNFGVVKPVIKVDGKQFEVGRVVPNAPVQLDGLEVGTRTVEITHPDYEPWKQTVAVRDQESTTVEVKLAPKPGRLALRANPPSITLTLNGRTVRPEEVKGGELLLPAGEAVALVASAKGFKSAARTVTLAANGRDSWEIALEKQTFPEANQAWENTLGMKFVPVAGTGVLFGVWDVRVQDYQTFVDETRREWTKPGFEQGPTHPAVNVSWDDAKAFCAWLTEKERSAGRLGSNQSYRLPMDAEWSKAVGPDKYPWGDQWPPPRGAGNYADATAKKKYSGWSFIDGYDDGYADTSPVGSFAANRYGLYDMGGNVWQRMEDGGLRGASLYNNVADYLASSNRYALDARYDIIGFRVVCVAGSVR